MGITSSSLRRFFGHTQTPLQLPSTTKTPAASTLPNDVILDILSRIPVKSLCRFRCVSKEWYALVSDPAFVAVHKSLAQPLLVVGSRKDDESLRLIDMDGDVVKVIDDVGSVWRLISTSRDSLVCVIGHSVDVKVVDLASGEALLTCQKDGIFGFGCATIPSSVYKMVCIDANVCEILTVGDNVGWRSMQFPPTSNISYTSDPVVVNGVLHVMLASQLDGDSILCFDLASEEWKKGIRGPPDLDLEQCEPSLSELNGSLSMVQPVAKGIDRWTKIWRLTNSDKSTWVKVYEMPFDLSWYCRIIPLRILHDEQRLLFCNSSESQDSWTVKIYEARRWACSDAPNTLFGVYGTNFSPCSLHLESFVLAKR